MIKRSLPLGHMQTKWVPRRSSSGFDLQTHRRRGICGIAIRYACFGKDSCWVLGTASRAALTSEDGALWYPAKEDNVGVIAATNPESLDAWWP